MRKSLLLFFFVTFLFACQQQAEQVSTTSYSPTFISSDIDNFWMAVDKIRTTQDSTAQATYLKELFIDKASAGQKAMFQVRNYQPEEYVAAINEYPLFWESIRGNTLKAKSFSNQIAQGVGKLNELYPLSAAGDVYFTMGVFRSPGTTLDSMVLIGSEFAFSDRQTMGSEFPDRMQYVRDYFKNDPLHDLVFLNVHEFVHTQQSSGIDSRLLNQAVREGVAEFMAEKATEQPSISPVIAYGKQHDAALKAAFVKQMFEQHYGYWLWGIRENPFDNQRDLGYYMGYAIAEKYYNASADKAAAIRDMIELDYLDDEKINAFVDQSQYFGQSIVDLQQAYEAARPTIINVEPFENGAQDVEPTTKIVKVYFSKPMNKHARGFDLGPLGKDHVLSVQKYIGISEDGKSATWEIKLAPNQRYQVVLNSRFLSEDGFSLKPYLIDIKTK